MTNKELLFCKAQLRCCIRPFESTGDGQPVVKVISRNPVQRSMFCIKLKSWWCDSLLKRENFSRKILSPWSFPAEASRASSSASVTVTELRVVFFVVIRSNYNFAFLHLQIRKCLELRHNGNKKWLGEPEEEMIVFLLKALACFQAELGAWKLQHTPSWHSRCFEMTVMRLLNLTVGKG